MAESLNNALRDVREAGRELDCIVAERVMGEVLAHAPCGDGLTRTMEFGGSTLAECEAAIRASYAKSIAGGMRLWPAEYTGPEYSSDIASAFAVVEQMKAKGYRWRIGTGAENETPTYAAFWHPEHTFPETYSAECMTPAHAICLAALRAIEAGASQSAVEGSPPSDKEPTDNE